jgi:hypothetical protein
MRCSPIPMAQSPHHRGFCIGISVDHGCSVRNGDTKAESRAGAALRPEMSVVTATKVVLDCIAVCQSTSR